jgi:UDP-glucose:(heptosyl)LPS alpha-1,3-glucosyltransferase
MKILISRKDLRMTASGVPKKVLQELLFFYNLGHESYAIAETVNVPMIEEFNGIPVKTFRWPFSGYFRRRFYQHQVQWWIKKHRPDLVIGHGDILHQDILFIHNCVHLAHELIEGCPLPSDHEVGKVHEMIFTKGSHKLLICNSQMMKNDLMKRFKLNDSNVEVIYPEVNLEKFVVADPEIVKAQWRSKLGIPQDAFVIGLVTSGNFKKRNLEMLIEAFIEVQKVRPEAYLFIAGGNIDERYKLSISKRVTFAPILIDVKNYYYLLDVFCLPAHIEEFGRSVLEAMFCGRPVVTTKMVGASEILEGRARELILDSITTHDLVEKLLKLFDPDFYQEIKELNFMTSNQLSSTNQNEKFKKILVEHQIL